MAEPTKTITVKGVRPTIEGQRVALRTDETLAKSFTCPGDCDSLTVVTEEITTSLIVVIGE